MLIRPATVADLETCRIIEDEAGRLFADAGMASVAGHPAPSLAVLSGYVRSGHVWVAADGDGTLAGYLVVEPVDGCLHIEQVSVRPAYAGRRIGRDLIEQVATWAAGRGHPALTLTTFVEVPWNGPYYRRCGFRFLADEELSPGLREIREHEAVLGLDEWPRACMRRDLP